MISGIDLSAIEDFILSEDKKDPTVWKLGLMPSKLFLKVSSEAKDNEIDTAYKLLSLSLKGWENFNIPYETETINIGGIDRQVVPMSILERIPLTAINELSIKAMEMNQLSFGERKN